MHILTASVKHETNTFSTRMADLPAFQERYLLRGDEIARNLRQSRSEMAAVYDAAERYGWELTAPIATSATPSGPVTRQAFDTFAGEIMAAIDAGPAFDGMLLPLHGAMVVEDHEDGEGLLLHMIRERVGGEIPIAVTLDLHANVTAAMVALADILVSFRTYPHIDQYETATLAAGLLQRTLRGEIRPRTVLGRRAMLDGADHGRTGAPGPMATLLAEADRYLEEPGVLAVSINGGFPWADIGETGPSALVVGDGADPRHDEIAEALAERIWEMRDVTSISTVSTDEALGQVSAAPGDGPVVLADFADNPGGGGYGDATRLLAGMLAAGLDNAAYALLADGAAAAACHAAGVDAEVSLTIGGKTDPRYGAPLEVTGTVSALSDGIFTYDGPMLQGHRVGIGPTAVLRVGGLDIVLGGIRHQVTDCQVFRHLGIEPGEKAVLAVKSAHHFRAAYQPIASDVIVVDDGGGLTSRNYKTLPYSRVRRPVWPLDLD